ncbi:TPA: phage tail protein [Escherichia coli]|uniref:phage tail protein n=1 Tax=Escherichia coli TaxID=562 RepID=UPI0017747898|nr:phage tail protein [Escherichia coli]MBA2201105.1 phage tail protein [Escherichia coli]HAJ2130339.1 phage tail protein [Escherichia coli]HAJ2155869.1 phage tail protein [Escherichia coli]
MAGTNDFKAFATDANANVTSQEEWETLTALKKGFSSGKASSAQVSKALRQPSTMAAVLGQFIANAELDALDDGDVDGLVAKLATAITTNLGLGEGAPAIGVPFFWPSAAMPNTVIDSWSSMVFLKFNGAKFSASDYPVLAKVFPSLVLPEARGDFIRIWDDGRGADGGRELLSWQEATNFSQFAGNIIGGGAGHAINFHDGISGNQPGFSRFNFTSNSVGDGVNFVAVRPRNIAFNFLVRAK